MRAIDRRDLIAGLLGGSVAAVAGQRDVARAQQPKPPVIAFLHPGSLDANALRWSAAFRAGLAENGYVEGQNAAVEYHWLEGQYDRVPALITDVVRRRVAVIATFGPSTALAAKAATATIPIVFGVGDYPVRLGLVESLSRPGGNLTGMNIFSAEAVSKRLGLLHELVPTANRIAVLVNPSNIAETELNLREVQNAARLIGSSTDIFKAATSREIEAAFAMMVRERAEALFVASDPYFASRHVQFATLATLHQIPTSFNLREYVEVGGLMSYGTDLAEMFHQVGIYAGRILKGDKPADLPVVQASKFEFVINLQTARALGIEVPPGLLALANGVIE